MEQWIMRNCAIAALALIGLALMALSVSVWSGPAHAGTGGDGILQDRFEYLSQHGNSNCSRAFMESIASMAPTMRLQGSCCGPMAEHRYREQVEGLQKYASVPLIPADPYDIPAGIAQQAMAWFAVELSAEGQAAYDYAMENSAERGPCCCKCWRWQVYGGLAKYLIREHDFTDEQVAELWDMSDGCGGDDHVH
ncbi:MAG: hypothetical protein J0I99_19895 [Devosia sp.]|uniref:hypothetical protein n=1 Tax=Devosia sp. TaxID=1871048 RepID=UPI001AC21ABB|nr:hypothetical protein [Devosia sp.]MBN9318009.1 hypothetical protein [Devosia sp.]